MHLELDLKSTLHLPSADFTIPMKADLPSREPAIQAKWDAMRLYHVIQEARKDAPVFVLHDGPPYTNSPIHIGTALNKVLKDFVVKSRTIMGYRAPYVPGYDNHGLPIEQTVMREFHERKEHPDVETLRKACRAHAQKYIEVQSEQFRRLGVFGLWEKPYATMNYRFEAEIVRVFKRMVAEGYVYRGLKPVLWSPTSRTALADTEIVYQDHASPAIYVRFPLIEDANGWAKKFDNMWTIIWTTTPWTIPANLAVAFHPAFTYAIVRAGDQHYVILSDLVERTMGAVGIEEYEVVEELLGASFEGTKFRHPIFERESIAVMAEYVTTEDGTGVVHTAPGHGRDDFYTGAKYGLPVLCPVDDRGVMTEEAGEFAGMSYIECNDAVIARMDQLSTLMARSDYSHSYPYAERDGKPVIFRATEQWFVSIDELDLRKRMLAEIDKVHWIPASGEARIRAMIGNRPDWCISRQRPWGVGIPIFYGANTGQPLLELDIIERVATMIDNEGSDSWFTKSAAEILPPGYTHPDTGETEFRKETDVFDVWFDSGSTSLCVLEGSVEPAWKQPWPADLYLEGSDQHRGWFNTSLIIGTACRGGAPYKAVLTHGFLLDEEGRKMSKRLMNALDPGKVCDQFGADILRLWCASVDYTNDVACSEGILKQFGESYRTLRNTMRFLLANLEGYEGGDAVLDVDIWLIEQTDLLTADCLKRYEEYDFAGVASATVSFCKKQLSAFYADAIKDRMYCDAKDWASRRSAQAACHHALLALTKILAPIIPHTAEEVYERIPAIDRLPSVHMEVLAMPSGDRLEDIEGNDIQVRFASLLEFRAGLFGQFEQWKAGSDVKDSQDVIASVRDRADIVAMLKSFGEDLPNFLKMSWIEIAEGDGTVEFRVSDFLKCDRCRLRRPDVVAVGEISLCERCRKVVSV